MQVQYWLDFRLKKILMRSCQSHIHIFHIIASIALFTYVRSNECWSYSWFLKCFGVNHLHNSWLTYVYQPYFILLEIFQQYAFMENNSCIIILNIANHPSSSLFIKGFPIGTKSAMGCTMVWNISTRQTKHTKQTDYFPKHIDMLWYHHMEVEKIW
jgi:hypothetical protein